MEIVYRWSVPVLWIFFWSYWGLSSLHTGKTEYAESKISRLFHLGMIGSAFAAVAFDRFHTGPLAWSILPESRLVILTGTIITANRTSRNLYGHCDGCTWDGYRDRWTTWNTGNCVDFYRLFSEDLDRREMVGQSVWL